MFGSTYGKNGSCLLLLIALVGSLLLVACPNPYGDEGIFTINIGPPDEPVWGMDVKTLSRLVHIVTLSGGPSDWDESRTVTGKETVVFKVPPGDYEVKIEAYMDGELFSVGSTTLYIQAGSNDHPYIKMARPPVEPEIVTYTVTFDSNGGSEVPSQIVVSGGTVIQPTDPTLAGNYLDGWYSDEDLTIPYNFSTPVTEDITLYAKWAALPSGDCLVMFNSNGGSHVPTQKVIVGDTAKKPDDPRRDGHDFDAWYSDENLTILYDFSTPVTGDIILYARWKSNIITYTVTFDANGAESGTVHEPQTVGAGFRITLPREGDLSKEGSVFVGWNTGADGMEGDYYPGDYYTVTGNVTFYAMWDSDIRFTVTFVAGPYGAFADGSTSKTVTFVTPSAATVGSQMPADPTRVNYSFSGWLISSGSEQPFTADTPVSANLSVYAQWEPQTYPIIYLDVGGGAFTGTHGAGYPTTHTYGTETLLDSPTKSDYTFDGWFIDASGTGTALTSLGATGYTANITLYAQWKLSPPVTIGLVISDMDEGDLLEQTVFGAAGESQTFTVKKGSYVSYQWYVDGESAGALSDFTFVPEAGEYEVAVEVIDTDGEKHSGRCLVVVR